MPTFRFGSNTSVKIEAASLTLAIRMFRVGVLFPHTYSTQPIFGEDAPQVGSAHRVALTSHPGAKVSVYGAGNTLLAEIDPVDASLQDEHALQNLPALGGLGGETGLVPSTGGGLVTTVAAAEQQALNIARQQAELARMTQALQAQMMALQGELRAKMLQVRFIQLFLGVNEEALCLRDGAPGAEGDRITVWQRVRCMDEELMLDLWTREPSSIGSFDAQSLDFFDQWAVANIDRLIPTSKGIQGWRVRRQPLERTATCLGEAIYFSQLEEAESHTYLLLRNGEQIWRLWVDAKLWPRLFPSAADAMVDTSRITYEAQVHKDRRREVLAGMTAIMGILQRSDLLHPLPRPNLSPLSPQDVDDHFTLISDGEAVAALGDGRQWEHLTYFEYRKWLQSQLTAGLRVMVRKDAFESGREGWDNICRRVQVYRRSFTPHRPAEKVYTLEALEHKTYYGATWQIRVLEGGRRWPFAVYESEIFPLDLMDWRVVESVIRNSILHENPLDERDLQLLWSYYKVLRAEAAREAPFIDLVLVQAGLDESQRPRVERLLRWWKLKTQAHRSLTKRDEALALRMVLRALKRGADWQPQDEPGDLT